MQKVIDLSVTLCIFMTVVLLGKILPISIGGCTAFILLLPIFYYLSYIERRAQWEMSILSLLLLLIIWINYLNYLDLSGAYTKWLIALSYCILHWLALFSFCIILFKPLNYSYVGDHADKVAVIRQNFKFIILNYLLFSLCYAIATCLIFISFQKANKLISNLFRTIPISFVWIPLFLILMKFSLKNLKDEHLDNIFKKDEINLRFGFNIKRVYFGLMAIIIVFGSVIELIRNEWMLWAESFISINLVIVLFWKVYRHRASPSQSAVLTDIDDVTLLNNPKTFIKIVCLNTVMITIITVGLIMLFTFYK